MDELVSKCKDSISFNGMSEKIIKTNSKDLIPEIDIPYSSK